MGSSPNREPWSRYGDIVDHCRQLIDTGELAPGHLLTTEQLAAAHGVHRNTAYRALTVLKNEGLLRGTSKGTVVVSQNKHDRLRTQLVDTLNELGVTNINDYVRWDPDHKTWVLTSQA